MAIYSGADLFLMPSKSEPCGLSQMIAMRYGTVPIVRETGGLRDSVQPYEAWRDAGTGFTFANYASGDMLYVIREAVYLYKDYPEAFARLQGRAMKCDFSWNRSAKEYLRIYDTITGRAWIAEEAPAEEKPVKKTRKTAAKKTAEKTEERKPAAKKTTAKKPTEKTAEKKAAAKKTTKKAEVVESAPAETAEEAPVKKTRKTAVKKETTKKETTKKGPAKSKKDDAAE